ncbi:MAG: hypothetical protein WA101_00645 [Minisyncoccia bacterium]
MSYPLIILGAGASHDYSSKGKHAPLTNQLIENDHLRSDLLKKYIGAGSLLSEIGSKIKKGTRTFEEVLTDFQNEMSGSIELQQQFVALAFYLQELFEKISIEDSSEEVIRKHEFNNYQILINNIYRYCSGNACIVTFNYDSLFERNLRDKAPSKMSDYIQNSIKIIKLHGSHNWVYVNHKEYLPHGSIGLSAFQVSYKYPDFFIKIKDDGRMPEHQPSMKKMIGSENYLTFPAIAVPLTGKDTYICPPAHIAILERELDNIDRILIVGWKAGDKKLLETIKKHPSFRQCKILVISGSFQGAKKIVSIIKTELETSLIEAYNGNFSDFMGDNLSAEFFK